MVKVAGGGNFHDDNGTFDIGRRNHTMMRKIFWKAQVLVAAEDVGRQQVADGAALRGHGPGDDPVGIGGHAALRFRARAPGRFGTWDSTCWWWTTRR